MNDEIEAGKEDTKPDESAAGLQARWLLRLKAARDFLEDFHNDGDTVDREYRGEGVGSRLNLFYSDATTKMSQLSGNPKVRARRRYADANDDVARVSATVLDRVLNADIQRDTDGYRKALELAKQDRFLPGLGQVRFRYVVKTEDVETDDPENPGQKIQGKRKAFEDVETDYVKWRRFLYDPSETWDDVQAVFYGLDLSKAEWELQFPGKPFRAKGSRGKKRDEIKEAFARAEVWEIWDKETKRILFLSENETEILKVVPDPFGLPGFFPSPEPLLANVTTSKCVPKSTYFLAKEQYDEAHELQKRIRKLVRQVKVTGGYDASNGALAQILTDAADGKLFPIKNFAGMGGKDGIASAISLLPIKDTVEAIIALSNRLALVKQEIYEITGQSDIARGQATTKATATEQRIKARFLTGRLQSEQDELARFASDAQRIRAFLIAKFFDAETLAQRANIQPESEDAQLLPKAIDLLKSSIADYRIDVDADSLAMTDFDAVQQDGIAIMQATAEYFGKVAPVVAGDASSAVFAAEMYQQMISGFRGSERFEPVIDRYVAQMKQRALQPPAPPQPDPSAMAKVQTEQIKAGAAQVKAQAEVVKAHAGIAQTVVDAQAHAQKAAMDSQEARVSFGERMAERRMEAEFQADVAPGFEGRP